MRAYLLEMILITAVFVGALAVPLVQANDADSDPVVSKAQPVNGLATLSTAPSGVDEFAAPEEPIGQCFCP